MLVYFNDYITTSVLSRRELDEHHKTIHPDGIVDNLADFVDKLLKHQPYPHRQ